jgi:two-component system, LuxR family, sensor kinase FixL
MLTKILYAHRDMLWIESNQTGILLPVLVPGRRMNWLTVICSMGASACFTIALIHLVIWFKDPKSYVHLFFAMAALAVVGIAAGEILMMLAQTPRQFGFRMRWTSVPISVAVVSIVWFLRFYFHTGRLWLAWLVCAIRIFVLLLNFVLSPNLNYRQIVSLQQVNVLGLGTASVPQGVFSPWIWVGELSSLLLLAFVIDATFSLWRRQDHTARRRAIVVGGSIVVFVVAAAGQTVMIHSGLIEWPYVTSLMFLVPVAAMGYELGSDVVRSAVLAHDLEKIQRASRENEQSLNLAATTAGVGMWRWDIDSDDVWMSQACRDLFGLDTREPINLDRFVQLLHPDDRITLIQFVSNSMSGDGDHQCEFRIPLPDGHLRWITGRGRVEFNGQNKPKALRGISLDDTGRKQAEREQARQRAELAHLSRVAMLGELSGSLAHELNQPLAAILSNAQAALQFLDHDPIDLDEVRGILNDIVAEDRRAHEVIRRLRLLFGKGEGQFEPLDLNELVLEVLDLMKSDLVNHGVMVQTEMAVGLPPVSGDRVQLQQVLINLIVNASDAMAENKSNDRKLCVATRIDDSGNVALSVADAGSGIPPDEIEHIFEPFYTTKTKGMGLGLAICRTVASAHAGKLWATNNPDRGVCFHLSLSPVPAGAT